jgi:hypothetical protein
MMTEGKLSWPFQGRKHDQCCHFGRAQSWRNINKMYHCF